MNDGKFFLDYILSPTANPNSGKISWTRFFKKIEWPITPSPPPNVLRLKIDNATTYHYVETVPFVLEDEECGSWLEWAFLPAPNEDVKTLAMKNPNLNPTNIGDRGIANCIDFPLFTDLLNRTNFSELMTNGFPSENLERQQMMAEHTFEVLKPKLTELIDTCNRRESIKNRNFENRNQRRPDQYSNNQLRPDQYSNNQPMQQHQVPQYTPQPLQQREFLTPFKSNEAKVAKKQKRRPVSESDSASTTSYSDSSSEDDKRSRKRKEKKRSSKKHKGKKSR